MTLIDTLRPEHLAIVAAPAQAHRQPREHAPLPQRHQLHAVVPRRRPAARGRGTCGRLIWPESTRCTACRKRRHWLLTHAFQPRRGRPVRAARRRRGRRRRARRRRGRRLRPGRPPARRSVRAWRSLPALVAPEEAISSADNADGIAAALPAPCGPACGHDPPARVILGGRLHASEVAQSPTDILSGPFAGSSRPVEVHARRLRNCGRRPTFFCRPDPAGGARTSDNPPLPAAAGSRAIRGRRKSVRGREQKPPRQRLIGYPAQRSTPLGTGPPHRSRIRASPGLPLTTPTPASTQRSGRRRHRRRVRSRRHPRSPSRRRPDPRRAHRPRRPLFSWV